MNFNGVLYEVLAYIFNKFITYVNPDVNHGLSGLAVSLAFW